MFKLPDNIYYKIFDLSFANSTHRYVPKEDICPVEEATKNRDALKLAAKAEEVMLSRQVHGDKIHYADTGSIVGQEQEADGCFSDKPGILLAIQTADCVPVLFCSSNGNIVGAAHAGWKGAKLNIIDRLYERLSHIGKNFSAIIGPAIAQKSYEVNADFYQNFLSDYKTNERFFIDSVKDGLFMFDLPGYVRSKLEKLPLENIYHINEDTYSTTLPDGSFKYPSYRRSCHTGEFYPRSLVSTIMMRK